jgi:hypothetical protein
MKMAPSHFQVLGDSNQVNPTFHPFLPELLSRGTPFREKRMAAQGDGMFHCTVYGELIALIFHVSIRPSLCTRPNSNLSTEAHIHVTMKGVSRVNTPRCILIGRHGSNFQSKQKSYGQPESPSSSENSYPLSKWPVQS